MFGKTNQRCSMVVNMRQTAVTLTSLFRRLLQQFVNHSCRHRFQVFVGRERIVFWQRDFVSVDATLFFSVIAAARVGRIESGDQLANAIDD